MKTPKSAKVFETPNCTYWLEGDILNVVVKTAPELSREERDRQIREFRNMVDGKRVCSVIDLSEAAPISRERRVYNSEKLPVVFKAIAFIATNHFQRMLAKIYAGNQPLAIPNAVFENEKEAKEWLREFEDGK
jgi:hypothetical protein